MSLYTELRRRNVFRVAAAYIVIGWLTLQVADVILGFTGAPEWVGKTLIALLVLGFIPALALAWVFEVGPDGVRIDKGQHDTENVQQARRLDVITLVAVFFVFVLMAWQHLGPAVRRDATSPTPTEHADTPNVKERAAAAPSGGDTSSTRGELEPFEAAPGSIAVLPFTNRSAEPDTAYFVDGVHDDLLTELSRNPTLTVISRTSVLEYRDTTKNLRQIGEELGVANVMEGAVQRAGQRVRITAQLIDARTDKHLWAETFDRELKPESVFEIQTEIATAIAGAMNEKLGVTTPTEPGHETQPPTRNAAAYDAYLRARPDRENWAAEAIESRMALYHQAVEADPDFVLAMSELSREYANRYWFISRRDEDRRSSRAWIDRALALKPDDPQLRLALAEHYYRAELDWDAALAELQRAEQGLPGSAELVAMRGYIHRRAGRPREAIAALLRAARLDPRSWTPAHTLSESYFLTGRDSEAMHWASIVRGLPNVPEAIRSMYFEWLLSLRTGDATSMLAELDRLDALDLPATELGPTELRIGAAYRARDWARAARYVDALESTLTETQFRIGTQAGWRARLARAQGDEAGSQRHAAAAKAQIEALVAADPDDYRAWIEQARIESLLGNLDAARAAIDRAMRSPTLVRDALIRSEVMGDVVVVLARIADSGEVARAMDAYLALPMHYASFTGLLSWPELDRHRDHPAIQAVGRKYANDGGGA